MLLLRVLGGSRLFRGAATLALACPLFVPAAGCAPVQVVEVQTDPPGATVFRIDEAGRTRLGPAPVRFTAHAEAPFRVRAEREGYAPAESEIPARDVQAFLELHLAPRGVALDDALLLRLLLIRGPQDLAALGARAPELRGDRAEAAARRLLRRGEIRALRPRGARSSATGGTAKGNGALSSDTILDVTALGFRRLESRGSADATLERLLVSRLALYRRWRRAARLLGGPVRDDGR